MQNKSSESRIIYFKKNSKPSKSSVSPQISGIRLFSRLIIGSISLGLEELNSRLFQWNDRPSRTSDNLETLNPVQGNGNRKENENFSIIQLQNETDNSHSNETSFAVIGLLLDTQNRIQSGINLINRFGKNLNRATIPILRPFNRRWLPKPLNMRFNRLVNRGENEIQRWISTGKSEYLESKRYTQAALGSAYDETMGGLAENPEIRELIQSQSLNLAEELVEEIRERTVSADYYLETHIRSFLKRKPRKELPPPSDEVIKSASTRKKYIDKN